MVLALDGHIVKSPVRPLVRGALTLPTPIAPWFMIAIPASQSAIKHFITARLPVQL
ncbi:hypothetical protein [Candidatus Amarolinea dominans]|uniref:hypothetical protein n=1 Tax=Candidatus Amarolinea dominans TaxID=3140696 RepID=UPI001D8FEFD6|nr:hypothetical protein [Anaerolineae bacterium]